MRIQINLSASGYVHDDVSKLLLTRVLIKRVNKSLSYSKEHDNDLENDTQLTMNKKNKLPIIRMVKFVTYHFPLKI